MVSLVLVFFAAAVPSLQMEPMAGEDNGDDGNSSSYTSVYTWTTATGTVTNTAQMGKSAHCLALTNSN